MSKYNELKSRLDKCICKLNLTKVLTTVCADEILVAEYEKDKTAHILSQVDRSNNTCCFIAPTIESLDETTVFYIINSPTIDFIPIDGNNGLIAGTKFQGFCDFVFYNEHNFCFVELKLNASSIEERAVRKNRKKAVQQLFATIEYFDTELSRNYSGLTLEAHVGTPDTYPRADTAWQSVRVKFLEEKGIDLFEGRKKQY